MNRSIAPAYPTLDPRALSSFHSCVVPRNFIPQKARQNVQRMIKLEATTVTPCLHSSRLQMGPSRLQMEPCPICKWELFF